MTVKCIRCGFAISAMSIDSVSDAMADHGVFAHSDREDFWPKNPEARARLKAYIEKVGTSG